MSPKKLSDSEQQEIIQLYRTSAATTATLAQRYGVSSSTINRFLKSNFSPTEYEELVHKKRLIGRKIYNEAQLELNPIPESPSTTKSEELKPITESPSTAKSEELELIVTESSSQQSNEELVDVVSLNELLGEDLEEISDEEEEDDYPEEDDSEESKDDSATVIITNLPQIEILPLSEAYFPKICYVVIDRFAELITKPLREFGDLGKIPTTEIEQKTLPIFDNQKVARRFSNRSQRVIKIPDGRLLKKTATYLKAKGITRLLIDGQVYAC
ncbi:MAG: transposase [Gloeocapsa sp. DLM2.Bin57]|nr:MAG: transposase [Gloeocapsa sp. DLM2.Bin57]